MHDLLRAAGLADDRAHEYDVDGERLVVVRLDGAAEEVRRRVRAALTGHYPVLLMDTTDLDRDFFRTGDRQRTPADVLARAAAVDLDAHVARWSGRWDAETLGEGDEGYYLDAYDVR
ncbi:hypothetical protein ABZS66_39820 [Dactylosporangium sp. NPDC005572]|uniref:hypothetical protein n=1 Tax=Dactylosporangium sp. NPDC005572 TaxID=3156889 RepID=UPI0033A8E949